MRRISGREQGAGIRSAAAVRHRGGRQAPKGDTGPGWAPSGPMGAAGMRGDTGPQGPQGVPGERGVTGAQGPAGALRELWAPGNTGAEGPKGDTDPAGAMGPEGPRGEMGPGRSHRPLTGPLWANGNQAPWGIQGLGPTGPQDLRAFREIRVLLVHGEYWGQPESRGRWGQPVPVGGAGPTGATGPGWNSGTNRTHRNPRPSRSHGPEPEPRAYRGAAGPTGATGPAGVTGQPEPPARQERQGQPEPPARQELPVQPEPPARQEPPGQPEPPARQEPLGQQEPPVLQQGMCLHPLSRLPVWNNAQRIPVGVGAADTTGNIVLTDSHLHYACSRILLHILSGIIHAGGCRLYADNTCIHGSSPH